MTTQAYRFLRGAAAATQPVSPRSIAALDHWLFGAGKKPGGDGIWLSACDGAAVSPRAHAAATATYAQLVSGAAPALPHWFDDLRRRLIALFGAPGCDAALAASEADAENLFLSLACATLARPVLHIAAAAPERPDAPPCIDRADSEFASVPLRDRYGLARDAGQVDSDAFRLAEQAIARGHSVALHVTDCSETGLAGPTRAAATVFAAFYPGRIAVLIDARQMRCEPEQIRQDLAAGFAVLLSGSTFAGGPAGASALLLPAAFVEQIENFALPDVLGARAAAMNWPPGLRDRLSGDFPALADIGLGLRWEAALAELEAFFAIDPDLRAQIRTGFACEIRRHLAAAPALKLSDCGWRAEDSRTIFPILTFDERGRALKPESLRRALANPAARGRPVHVAAPLRIGALKALRLSLSAPLVNDVAGRIGEGRSFAAAFQPLAEDLLETFVLWSDLAAADSI